MSRIWGKSKQNKGDKRENTTYRNQSNILIKNVIGFFSVKTREIRSHNC